MKKRPLVITPGDPNGVGPEVTVAALKQSPQDAVVVGHGDAFRSEAERQGLEYSETDVVDSGVGVRVLDCTRESEPVEVRALRLATEACLKGDACALVTGPIHKGRLVAQGFAHRGHTEFLAELCGSGTPTMAFVGQTMRVALVTTHLPLTQVPEAVTADSVYRVIRQAADALRLDLGVRIPRLVVCGLNPHAGEGGLLGHEDEAAILPACERATSEGIEVLGPISAEAAARLTATGEADMMVAMYHDQGLTPLKVLDFGSSVNWTLGLPIIRTSVDHGTADDIVGLGVADPGSMACAIELARQIVDYRALSSAGAS